MGGESVPKRIATRGLAQGATSSTETAAPMNVTYKHLRLFVEEEEKGWRASICDLSQFEFVHDGRRFHATIEAAQKEAETKVAEILNETAAIDWTDIFVKKARALNQ
jgi:hypothetical protein